MNVKLICSSNLSIKILMYLFNISTTQGKFRELWSTKQVKILILYKDKRYMYHQNFRRYMVKTKFSDVQ